MILSGNGKTYTVPGKNLKINVSLSLVRKDISGQTSDTSTVSAGNKPKKISCALTIPQKSASDLQDLCGVAEAVQENGDPIVYAVTHPLIEAMKIREVTFCDNFKASESDSIRAWDITFTLQEHKSVAEKKEEREKNKEVAATTAEGKEVKGSEENSFKNLLAVTKEALP